MPKKKTTRRRKPAQKPAPQPEAAEPLPPATIASEPSPNPHASEAEQELIGGHASKSAPPNIMAAGAALAPTEPTETKNTVEDVPKTPVEPPEVHIPPQTPPEPAPTPPAAPTAQQGGSGLIDVPMVNPTPRPEIPIDPEGCRFGPPFGFGSTSSHHLNIAFVAYQFYCAIELELALSKNETITQLAFGDLPQVERDWWQNSCGWFLPMPGAPASHPHDIAVNAGVVFPNPEERGKSYVNLPVISRARYEVIRKVTQHQIALLIPAS